MDIIGTINERRRTFTSADGETGHVDFGRTIQTKPGANGNRISATTVRVQLASGREAYGRYHNAGNVRLTLKAIYTKAGKRLDKHY